LSCVAGIKIGGIAGFNPTFNPLFGQQTITLQKSGHFLCAFHHGEGIGLALSGVTITDPVGQSDSQLKQTIQSEG